MAPQELVYKEIGSHRLKMRLFLPDSPGSRPAMLLFHGGSWINGSPEKLDWIGERFSRRGWVVGAAQYRLVGRETSTVADCVADAIGAAAWFRRHAADWTVDAGRITLGGASAGGHLALCVALAEKFAHPELAAIERASPATLVMFNPVVSVRNSLFSPLFEGLPWDLDPTTLVGAGLPPTLIMHGSADAVVPLHEVQQFASRARAAGASVRVELFEGKPHAFFNPGMADRGLLDEMETLIASFLRDSGQESS